MGEDSKVNQMKNETKINNDLVLKKYGFNQMSFFCPVK